MAEEITTTCCIAGGGPAGMMLGFLLARAGVDAVVLEKHGDFLRDFRGDTVHPSTLELMYELGLLAEFLRRPHQKLERMAVQIGQSMLWLGDLRHLPTHAKYIAFMPQWDFLNFLVECARAYPEFHLRMQTEATGLLEQEGVVCGVRARTPQGELLVRSRLVIGADGRHSVIREKAGLTVEDKGAPMDVLWMRVSRHPDDPGQSLGRVVRGHMMVMLNRGEYWQCAFLIPKGAGEAFKARGVGQLRQEIAQLIPWLSDRVSELNTWDQISLLTVKVDRLKQWYKPGLLCIGDAAHAMSPIGGVGINLAVQDAVAAANILAAPLRAANPERADPMTAGNAEHTAPANSGPLAGPRAITGAKALPDAKALTPFLEQVQRRREFPTRVTQRLQILAQNRVISPILAGARPIKVPLFLKLLQRFPVLQRIPARAIGMGARPEHVKTPDSHQQQKNAG
ncbi:MAG: FAD-dependent oxidoreductase [Actinomycetota bacterium]